MVLKVQLYFLPFLSRVYTNKITLRIKSYMAG